MLLADGKVIVGGVAHNGEYDISDVNEIAHIHFYRYGGNNINEAAP